MTSEGCPIQAEATDPDIQRLIVGYSNYKRLNNSNAPAELQLKALDQCGATELCPDFLCAMEPIYMQIVEKTREEQAEKREKEREYKEKVAAMQAKAKRR